jgi:hypothetical protein
MATKTRQRKPAAKQTATNNSAAPRTPNLDRLAKAARQATRSSIDAYEGTMIRVADTQDTIAARAEGTPAKWIAPVLNAQAAFTRDTAGTVARYYRKLAL